MAMPRLLAGNQVNTRSPGPFTQPLIERMLRLVTVSAPDSLSRIANNHCTVSPGSLAETLHLKLLFPGNKDSQPLVIRQHTLKRDIKSRGIPKSNQGKQCGNVFGHRGIVDIAIHLIGTRQELIKNIGAKSNHIGDTDAAPHRKPTANPVPQRI